MRHQLSHASWTQLRLLGSVVLAVAMGLMMGACQSEPAKPTDASTTFLEPMPDAMPLDARDGSLGPVEAPGLEDASLDDASLEDANLQDAGAQDAAVADSGLDASPDSAVVDPLPPCDADSWMAWHPNLRGCDLRGAELIQVNLDGVDLSDARLEGANLFDAHLVGADLRRANLEGAVLAYARLSNADLRDANLDWAYMSGIDIRDADLRGASLDGSVQFSRDATNVSPGPPVFDPAYADGAKLYGLQTCPTGPHEGYQPTPTADEAVGKVPPIWVCVETPHEGYVIFIRGGDLSGTDLSGVPVAPLQSVTARAYDLAACPDLPSSGPRGDDFRCLQQSNDRFTLVGPRLDLRGADLTELDLRGALLTGARTHGLTCPAALPGRPWSCRQLPAESGFAILGPGVDLSDANLDGADLGGLDLTGARLRAASDLIACPHAPIESVPPNPWWECTEQDNGLYRLRPGSPPQTDCVPTTDMPLCPIDPNRVRQPCPASMPDGVVCVYTSDSASQYTLIGPGVDIRNWLLWDVDISGADLTDADLTGVRFLGSRAVDLLACPSGLPTQSVCVVQPNGLYMLVGLGLDLRDADLRGLDLTGAGPAGEGSCPAQLPGAGWTCRQTERRFSLAGPGVDLEGFWLDWFDFAGLDLTGASLLNMPFGGVRTVGLVGCPAVLPSARSACVTMGGGFVLLGPDADISSLDFAGVDLTGVDLAGADVSGTSFAGTNLTGARLVQLDACPAALPGPQWQCVGRNVVGPGADLSGAVFSGDLTGADLTGLNLAGTRVSANLTGADLSGADLGEAQLFGARVVDLAGCPAVLPARSACVVLDSGSRVLLAAGADLSGLDLSGLDLSGLDLRGSDLGGSSLAGAATTGTRLTELARCPATLPGFGYVCAAGDNVLGPGVDASEAEITGSLAGADLRGVNLESARVEADLAGLDLSGADLSGAELSDARTAGILGCPDSLPDARARCVPLGGGGHALLAPGVDLTGADLSGADLSGVDLTGAMMLDVDLAGADLHGASLAGISDCPAVLPAAGWACFPSAANLLLGPGIDASGSNLTALDLVGVDLSGAVLDRAVTGQLASCPIAVDVDFACAARADSGFALLGPRVLAGGVALSPGTELGAIDLRDAWLRSALWPGADLRGANLSGAVLLEATLDGANLSDADLSDADLTSSSLWGADLTRADLTDADLSDANLRECTMTETTTTGAFTSFTTLCPDGTRGGCAL